jgi:hypothetical protein
VLTGPVGTLTYAEFKALNPPSYPHFETEEMQFGSWLSKLTGVHISPKGVSLSAPDPIGFVKDVITNPIADIAIGTLLIPGVGGAVLHAAGSVLGAGVGVVKAIPSAIAGAAKAVTGGAQAATSVASAANTIESLTAKSANAQQTAIDNQIPSIDYANNVATLNGLTLPLNVYQQWISANPTAPAGAVFLAAYNATPAAAPLPSGPMPLVGQAASTPTPMPVASMPTTPTQQAIAAAMPIGTAMPVPIVPNQVYTPPVSPRVPISLIAPSGPMARTTAQLAPVSVTATAPSQLSLSNINPLYLVGGAALLLVLSSSGKKR